MSAVGFIGNRISGIVRYAAEVARHGMPVTTEPVDREVVFLVCGVGRSHFAAAMVRRMLRERNGPIGTVLFDWQFGLPGEIWTDLMWYRRNRVMGARLARRIAAFRRRHPETKIHVFAFSGGCGVAVFALESLRGRRLIDTLVLAAPAIKPAYNLAPALRTVQRAYAFVSSRDRFLLGIGTRVFGTTDRAFTQAAGHRGFRIPLNLTCEEEGLYSRLKEIHWSPEFKADGHYGGHADWCHVKWLSRYLLPVLRGRSGLPTQEIGRRETPPQATE